MKTKPKPKAVWWEEREVCGKYRGFDIRLFGHQHWSWLIENREGEYRCSGFPCASLAMAKRAAVKAVDDWRERGKGGP